MAHPCHDCGKVLATRGGLDVHRAQWCTGAGAAPLPPAGRTRRLGRRFRGGTDEGAGQVAAAPGAGPPPPAPAEPFPVEVEVVLEGRGAPSGAFERRGGEPESVPAPPEQPSRPDAQPPEPPEPPIDLTTGSDDEVELSLIMWLMRRRVHSERLPAGRTVVRFDFTGARQESYWVVLEPPEVTLCITSPRTAVDVVVTADAGTFRRVFLGRMLLADAMGDDLVRLEGPEPLVQSLPRWFEWSHPVTAPTGAG